MIAGQPRHFVSVGKKTAAKLILTRHRVSPALPQKSAVATRRRDALLSYGVYSENIKTPCSAPLSLIS